MTGEQGWGGLVGQRVCSPWTSQQVGTEARSPGAEGSVYPLDRSRASPHSAIPDKNRKSPGPRQTSQPVPQAITASLSLIPHLQKSGVTALGEA